MRKTLSVKSSRIPFTEKKLTILESAGILIVDTKFKTSILNFVSDSIQGCFDKGFSGKSQNVFLFQDKVHLVLLKRRNY